MASNFLYFSFPFIEAVLHIMCGVVFCLISFILILLCMNSFYFVNVSMNSSNPSFPTSYKWIHLILLMNSLFTWIHGIFYIPWIHLLHDFTYYMIFTEFIKFMNSSICDFHWVNKICEFIYLHPLMFFLIPFFLAHFKHVWHERLFLRKE